MNRFALAAAFAVLVSPSAIAGTIFNCEVTQFFKFNPDVYVDSPPIEDGPLERQLKGTTFGDFYIGKRFSVDTGTGMLMGELMNVTSPDVKRYILDPGGGQNAFKMMEVWGPIRSVRYTTIATYDIVGTKPFVMVESGDVYSGECH